VKYLEQVHAAYEALRTAGVTVDILAPGAPLDGYRLVVAPALYLVDDETVSTISSFVEQGGTALVTFLSGIVDADDRVRMDPTGNTPPGAFSSLLGAWTEQFFPLLPHSTVRLSDGASAGLWTELVRTTTAQVGVRFERGPVAGHAAITRNAFGRGAAWYLATALDEASYAAFMSEILAEAGVGPTHVPVGVELVTRSSAIARFTFVINHSAIAAVVPATGTELITGTAIADHIEVPAGGVRVVRHEKTGEAEQ
jgi:beta-galactosidase